jgi:hypothetical protein
MCGMCRVLLVGPMLCVVCVVQYVTGRAYVMCGVCSVLLVGPMLCVVCVVCYW